jgi:hypothetical protein
MEFRTTVVVEIYRVCCPECGIKVERVPQLPSKAPFSKRFEDAVGLACESASARQVARGLGMAPSTVRARCGTVLFVAASWWSSIGSPLPRR